MFIGSGDPDFDALQERIHNCDFNLPAEFEQFFSAFQSRLQDGLNPSHEMLWRDCPYPTWSDGHRRVLRDIRWIEKALAIVKPLAVEHKVDVEPLYWLERYVRGERERNIDNANAVCDCVRKIMLFTLGHDGRFIVVREREAAISSGSESSDDKPVHKDQATEARDKWIYEEAIKGTPWSTIVLRLKNKPKSWIRIETDNGAKERATAYAKRHSLPVPPPRKAGRPSSTNTNK